MSKHYYYQLEDQGPALGPLPIEQLLEMQQRGELPPEVKIRGMDVGQEWKPLGSLGKIPKPPGSQGKKSPARSAVVFVMFFVAVFLLTWAIESSSRSTGSNDKSSPSTASDETRALTLHKRSQAETAGYQDGQAYGRAHPGPKDPGIMGVAAFQGGQQGLRGMEQADYTFGFMDGYNKTRSSTDEAAQSPAAHGTPAR